MIFASAVSVITITITKQNYQYWLKTRQQVDRYLVSFQFQQFWKMFKSLDKGPTEFFVEKILKTSLWFSFLFCLICSVSSGVVHLFAISVMMLGSQIMVIQEYLVIRLLPTTYYQLCFILVVVFQFSENIVKMQVLRKSQMYYRTGTKALTSKQNQFTITNKQLFECLSCLKSWEK